LYELDLGQAGEAWSDPLRLLAGSEMPFYPCRLRAKAYCLPPTLIRFVRS
jgi:hypothetical protein